MRYNKRGISAVVATVLIILITVAAVTIIWAAIIPMINDNLNRGTVCLDAATALTIKNKGYTCTNTSGTYIQVGYGSNDIGLAGIQFLISDSAGNTVTKINDTVAALPTINGERVFFVSVADGKSVKIAPMIDVGGQVETCDASAPVDLTVC